LQREKHILKLSEPGKDTSHERRRLVSASIFSAQFHVACKLRVT